MQTLKRRLPHLQLDNARLFGAKNSPMMEGIEQCVDQVDEQVMTELAPRITYIIRKGTGLPTKVTTSFTFLQSLVLWWVNLHTL